MKTLTLISAVLMAVGCSSTTSSSGSGGSGPQTSGGKGGSSSSSAGGSGAGGASSATSAQGGGGSGGSGGASATTSSGAQGGAAGASSGAGGSSSAGGVTGSGGASTAGASGTSIDAASGGATGGVVDLWYEAESTDNELYNVKPKTDCTPTCDPNPKEGDSCCHGGGELTWIVGPQKSSVTFTKVTVPTAGDYDVTWWYHCGENDNYHDGDCGGTPHPTWMTYATPSGCRPHLLSVNDKALLGPKGEQYWQFPCFAESWALIHAATTKLTLTAGTNSIKLGAAHLGNEDAVDLDAIHVQAAGKGEKPLVVEPTEYAGDGYK